MLFYGWREVRMVDWLVLVQMLVLGFGKSSFLGDLYTFRALDVGIKKKEIVNSKCVYHSSILYTIPKTLSLRVYIKKKFIRPFDKNELFMYSELVKTINSLQGLGGGLRLNACLFDWRSHSFYDQESL